MRIVGFMSDIVKSTAKNLKWKTLRYMLAHDTGWRLRRHFFSHPLKYGWAFIKSLVKSKSFVRDGNFFLYNIDSVEEFELLLSDKKSLLVVGFSYCQKPLDCPCGRFTTECMYDSDNQACHQCFIGEAINALPDDGVVPLVITTANYIGDNIFRIVHENPDKNVIFLITSCELALTMFGDWGNMVNVKGIGVRLRDSTCKTFKAFEASEKGIKPSLTTIDDNAKEDILRLIQVYGARTIPRYMD